MLMSRFCKFQKQNRELSYASSEGQAGRVKRYFVNGRVPLDGRKFGVPQNCLKCRLSVGSNGYET
jgi:hypothetical protein